MARRGVAIWLAAVCCGFCVPCTVLGQAAAPAVDFSREIRPILSNKCFFCHGPDDAQRKGGTDGLRLDTPEGPLADLGEGQGAIVPGRPDQSPLVARITSTDAEESMPPASSGKKLSPHEIELLKTWIEQGAKYAGHWSYQRPVRSEPPAVRDPAWARNPIDRFLLARLKRENLKPAAEADRDALVRRVSLDLTGLPPTIAEADAFAHDADPQAYEKLVDRLMASPAYGEHWAQLWLDLARYGDSTGYAEDQPRTIWLFRDYVIRALNANKPFDQFTIEQLAGDLLPQPSEEQLAATAFHRNTLTNTEGGTNDEEYRNVAVVDRVNTTLAVWMGTTVACAQCHNHKYDPISQEEYFRLFAFFNNTEDSDRGDEAPLLSVYSDEQQRKRDAWQQDLARLELELKTPTPELIAAQQQWEPTIPGELKWHPAPLTAVKSASGAAVSLSDGVARVQATTSNDTYTAELTPAAGILRALRLEALPSDDLPGKGPGHAAGNFVLTGLTATVVPPQPERLKARYVRVELPGKKVYLHLAEVQVMQGNDNVALAGTASQINTAYDGPAKLAIDGNTDGRYFEAHSTSHTDQADDPWWEVDLHVEQPLDRILVWNRTDSGTGERTTGYRLLLLNERREPVWQQANLPAPRPSAEFSLSGERQVEFSGAAATFSQAGFAAEQVLNNKDPKQKGWAIGSGTGQPQALTLVTKALVEIPAGGKLIVTLEFASQHQNHTLGRFRFATSDDEGAVERGRTPQPVLEALAVPVAARNEAQAKVVTEYFLTQTPLLQPTRERVAQLGRELAQLKPVTVPVMRELPAAARRVTRLQHRGNFLDLGMEVSEGTPAAFPPLPADVPRNRLALARWLVDANNPLTARVIVNRYWEHIFGIGIVSSSEEFGAQGELPVHPELLDWLATELMQSHWDTKALVRLLVTSAAYRQSARVTPELEQRDPDNRLLARGPRFRLSAEVVRDQALFVSGLLSPKMYGPSVKPSQPAFGLNAAFGGGVDWQTSEGEDRYRRGLYTVWRRSSPYPSMATFDAPNREVCTLRRVRTNTPLQALVTLNDPVYVEASQALARRICAEVGSQPRDGETARGNVSQGNISERAVYGFRLCLARAPTEPEVARIVALYERALARFVANADDARRMATEPLGPPPAGANVAELAAWTVVGGVLLNLDETLMKR